MPKRAEEKPNKYIIRIVPKYDFCTEQEGVTELDAINKAFDRYIQNLKKKHDYFIWCVQNKVQQTKEMDEIKTASTNEVFKRAYECTLTGVKTWEDE